MKTRYLTAVLVLMACASWGDPASHRKAVDDLFQTLDMRGTVVNMAQLLTDQFCSMDPQLQTYRDEIAAYVWKYLGWDALREDLARLYMESFSEEDLRAMAAFYATPAGRKSLQQMPELARQAAQLGQQRFDAHLTELSQLMKNKELDKFMTDVQLNRPAQP